MANYPNYLDMQKQAEMKKIADAQSRLAAIDQQMQMQQSYFPQNMSMNTAQQPQVQFLGLNGKFVQSAENITANDVPMDGSIAFFPKQDMTEVYVRAWQGDGTIKNVIFRPVEPIVNNQPDNSALEQEKSKYGEISNILDSISARIDNLTNRFDEFAGKQKTNTKAKKETEADVKE